MISIDSMTKKYGDFTAIEDINFTICEGTVYGLAGFNGAGKTTLLKTMAGVYKPDHGKVTVNHHNTYDNEAFQRSMFIVPDDPYFVPQASLNRMRWFYKDFYPHWSDQAYKELLKLFKLDARAAIIGFSKGMQRLAAILLALSALPQYLFMDEAFDGLDLSKRNLLKKLLRQYVAEKKAIAVVSSHNLLELEDFADHIGIIRNRKLFFNSSVEKMKSSRVKYHVIFREEFSGELLKSLGGKQIRRHSNREWSFIADGHVAQIRDRLYALNPLNLTALPVTLEEFFLEDSEEEGYDFHGIFSS